VAVGNETDEEQRLATRIELLEADLRVRFAARERDARGAALLRPALASYSGLVP
jgi:hypothetical protein